MARSVVLKGTVRCPRCQQSPRWCICAGLRSLEMPLAVDVLMHHAEVWKPTSTGHLIQRAIPASRRHIFRHDVPLDPASIARPNRERWILHPLGEPLPTDRAASEIQVLLLDGTWTQARDMAMATQNWGRRVSLPMSGESRYWLRSQQTDTSRFCTVEALLFLMKALGLDAAHETLRLQFELHVYAGLRGRGLRADADAFLATSPIRDVFPDVLAALNTPRART